MKKEGKTHAGATGTLRTSWSRRTRWTLSGKATVNNQRCTTASICIHHNNRQHPTRGLGEGRNRKQDKQKVVILHLDWRLPFLCILLFSRESFSAKLKRRWRNLQNDQHNLPPRPPVRGKHFEIADKEKNPQQFKSHHGSDVSVLSLLAGGSRQTLQRRQTNTLSFIEEEKVMCSRTKLSTVNNNKNQQTCKYVSVQLITNFETTSMWCYVRQNTLIPTEPQSVNTQLVRGDTYYN